MATLQTQSYDLSTGEVTMVDLTAAQIAERTAMATADLTAQTAQAAFHAQIVAIAQSAVGITLANLTAAQVKALAAVLLYKAGGVDPVTLQVLPLSQWA